MGTRTPNYWVEASCDTISPYQRIASVEDSNFYRPGHGFEPDGKDASLHLQVVTDTYRAHDRSRTDISSLLGRLCLLSYESKNELNGIHIALYTSSKLLTFAIKQSVAHARGK